MLLVAGRFFAQESSKAFSLQEAIDFAIENNRAAQNASKDIDAAVQRKWETTATGLPQINANVDYQNFLKQQVSLIPAEFFGGDPGEFAEVVFGTKQSVNATATLTQKVFDGSYLVGLQSAKVYLQISKNAKVKTDLEVRQRVIQAYGNVLMAEESEKILKDNVATLEKNLFDIRKIYQNGLEEEESVEQLEITLSGVKSNLNNVTRLKTLAYQMLNITLGLDVHASTVLTDNLESLTNQNIDLTLIQAEFDPENTIDFKIAENTKRSKELLLKLEKSKALPTLNTFINGGYIGFSNSFTFADRDQKWFGSSLFGLSMNIPIFSSLQRSSATQRAKIELEKSEADLLETEQQIKLQIASAKSNYEFAVEDYQNELRQAQMQLYSAQQEYLQAMLDVINNKAALETATNAINN